MTIYKHLIKIVRFMSSVFLSHKYSWLSFEEMDLYLSPIKQALEWMWYKVFCSLYMEEWFQKQWWNVDYIYERCCEQQASYDITLGIIRSSQDSYGMQLELDCAQNNNKPYLLLIQTNALEYERVSKYIERADAHSAFKNVSDLNLELLWSLVDVGNRKLATVNL